VMAEKALARNSAATSSDTPPANAGVPVRP
jgi:hypothetical protein